MKITSKSEYGLRCMLQIARFSRKKPLTINEIARSEKLPKDYVVQLLSRLRRHGLVKSVRGQHGGYVLARSPLKVSVADTIKALDGNLYENICKKYSGGAVSCQHKGNCGVRPVWSMLMMRITDVLESTSISDVLEEEKRVVSRLRKRFGRSGL